MGMRGPVGKMEKRTRGTRKTVSASSFPPPEYLSPLAKKYWNDVVAFFPPGHFTEQDRILLEQYCEAAAVHQEATVLLEREGRYATDRHGKITKHPAVKDQHEARCACAMLATKLRITKQAMISPQVAGRAALNAAQSAAMEEDEMASLLYKGNGQGQ